MVPVSLSVSAPDTCNTSCRLTGIAGTDGAIAGTDYTSISAPVPMPTTVNLRGAANSAAGRIYKVAVMCTDPATGQEQNKVLSVSVAGTTAPTLKQLGK